MSNDSELGGTRTTLGVWYTRRELRRVPMTPKMKAMRMIVAAMESVTGTRVTAKLNAAKRPRMPRRTI